MQADVKKRIVNKMDKAIETLKREIAGIRTGRASLSIFEGITVSYYDVSTPINQVATMAIPESRLITIQPWDPKLIPEIEKAILKSELGLNPTSDGKIIRIAIPPLTEERRKQIIKQLHKRVEESKVTIRNIRRDFNDEIKRLEKEEHVSEDETKRTLDEIQKLTDSYIKRTDEIKAHKETELMEV
ncbi:MAG: ribosome recycling factor [Thermodesulfovibrionia bacterium]|nr:ribosome recycling factor [Thermodesulfovibrionia bacterium]MCK5512141.1 ribosome recycling factor [Thermodesulfovibrionia bacterium]